MIVRDTPGGLLLFNQADHARLTGDLAAALRDPPAPASAFVAAARLHDNGWIEYDAAPLLDAATGIPHSYRHMPPWHYREVWRRGIARAVAVDPHLGLLVSLHGMQFFGRKRDPEDRAFLAAERDHETRLLGELGYGGTGDHPPDPIHAQFEWIRFLDGLSLFLCDGWESPWEADIDGGDTFVVRRDGDDVTVDPWPFTPAEVAYRVPGRRLDERRYPTLERFHEALQRATPETLEGRFRPEQAAEPVRGKASSTRRAFRGP